MAGSSEKLGLKSSLHCIELSREMATHSSVLAWRIPGTVEPDGLPSRVTQSRTRLKRLSSSSPEIGKLHNNFGPPS